MPPIDMAAGMPDVGVTVSEFVDLLNETYEFAFPSILITGELANFRVSKNKWVYFDLKDETASLKFFGTVYQLPGPLEEGMMLQVRGAPHMHDLYGFSINIQNIQVAGEGSIRRAAELLAAKLQVEGLFDPARKRPLPYPPRRIGLITSAQSAAYGDFIKILAARWSGLVIDLIDVQVQGDISPGQIVNAINIFNSQAQPPDVLVLIRGGGSAEDMAGFSTEQVTRAVASSRIPTLVAIGHEVDVSLAELAADKRGSTPSNAAELLVPDKHVVLESLAGTAEALYDAVCDSLYDHQVTLGQTTESLNTAVDAIIRDRADALAASSTMLTVLNPTAVLKRGYAVVRDEQGAACYSSHLPDVGSTIKIDTYQALLKARITAVYRKDTKAEE